MTSPNLAAGVRGRKAATLIAVAALAVLSACGSTTGAPSNSTDQNANAPGVAAAKKAVDGYLRPASSLNLGDPLKSKPPRGKTIVFARCNFSQCDTIGEGIRTAAQAVGWNYKEIPYDSANPATLVTALKQAVQYHPAAVALSGVPEPAWSSVLPTYRAANIAIVTYAVAPVTFDKTVIADIAGPVDQGKWASMLADWFIADSHGHGHALLMSVDDIPILKVAGDEFVATVKQRCPQCKVTTNNQSIAAAQSSAYTNATVSALQRDPSINYVFTTNGPFFTGLPAQLAAAGMANRVKIGSISGDVTNLANVKAGREAVTTGYAYHIGGWKVVDSVLRHDQGMTVAHDAGGLPTQLMTTGGDFAVQTSYDLPSDYKKTFEDLWQTQQ